MVIFLGGMGVILVPLTLSLVIVLTFPGSSLRRTVVLDQDLSPIQGHSKSRKSP